jgi:hypothetical protein
LRKLAQQKDLGLARVHTAVREKLNFLPHKVTAVQEFKPAEHDKRIRYYEWFTNVIQTKAADILDITFLTDVALFHLSSYVNTHKTRLWSSRNPYALHEKPLHDQKLGVWVTIIRRRIVGPLFFEEIGNSKRYCSMFHYFIGLLEEDDITYSWFQQDGATAHTANNSMKFLKEIFGERVISRNLWQPRSPDLTPPDIYLWGAAKSALYRNRPRTLNELRTAITAYIRNISQADL